MPALHPDQADAPVVVYSTPWCGYCVAARALLRRRGISFAEVDVAGDSEARAWLVEASGYRTVPQIFVHGRSIGGFRELLDLDLSGELERRLAGA
jgi:glutaredoxin 3